MATKFNTEVDKSLSEFISSVEIIRTNDKAEIIIDYVDVHPIRLLGFSTDLNKSDWEVYEEGFHYYQSLKHYLKKQIHEQANNKNNT